MQPIGLLMKEHRLIERMVFLVEINLRQSKKSLNIDTEFLHTIIDFFRTYADKIHHGKEEDILFQMLMKKNIPEEHKKTMNTLIEDHKKARAIIRALDEANIRYSQGYHASITEIHEKLSQITTLYPQHISKEDTQFFFPIMEFLDRNECDTMLQEFYDFDKTVIHEHYSLLIERLEEDSDFRLIEKEH